MDGVRGGPVVEERVGKAREGKAEGKTGRVGTVTNGLLNRGEGREGGSSKPVVVWICRPRRRRMAVEFGFMPLGIVALSAILNCRVASVAVFAFFAR
jgi:hypothetical protein